MTGVLAERRALVVGAGSGIGKAVAARFAEQGASVAVMDRDRDKCERLRSDRRGYLVSHGDATVPQDVADAVEGCERRWHGLDIVVCCVGVFDFYRGLEAYGPEDLEPAFEEIFAVNVRAAMQVARAALPALRRSRGCLILTESTSSHYAGRGGALYVSSKFALRGLRTALAHEWAPEVRVNSVAPGGTVGTELSGLASVGERERRLDDPGRAEDIAGRTPLGVALSGDDHAWSYVFLASEGARGMTGRALHSDGGMGVRS